MVLRCCHHATAQANSRLAWARPLLPSVTQGSHPDGQSPHSGRLTSSESHLGLLLSQPPRRSPCGPCPWRAGLPVLRGPARTRCATHSLACSSWCNRRPVQLTSPVVPTAGPPRSLCMPALAERLRRAYPAPLGRAGVGSIPANPDAQNVPSFRRWRFEMKLSPFFCFLRSSAFGVRQPYPHAHVHDCPPPSTDRLSASHHPWFWASLAKNQAPIAGCASVRG
jgi:hypothetical protein